MTSARTRTARTRTARALLAVEPERTPGLTGRQIDHLVNALDESLVEACGPSNDPGRRKPKPLRVPARAFNPTTGAANASRFRRKVALMWVITGSEQRRQRRCSG
ncbi:hypothetical protein [Streptomyces sioyaensis]|uniref:hypothetical protein n=1 Tax=Streptomyces sioyaensis TaxID=67364 RepID=UPI0037AE58D8